MNIANPTPLMISSTDWVKRAIGEISGRWFAEHKATVMPMTTFIDSAPKLTVITWQKPGAWCYAIRYVIWDGTLYVTGDLGSAVYRWSGELSLRFLAECNLDYFLGKCEASETGRDFTQWDDEVAEWYLNDLLKTRAESEDITVEKTRLFHYLEGNEGSRDECAQVACDYCDETGDSETASQISSAGEVPNMRGIAHWVDLRMAYQQSTPTPATP